MKTKTLKRTLVTFLTLAMLIGILAGSGALAEEPARDVLTITMAVNTQTPDAEATHLHKYLLDNFQINLEVTEYNSENWKTQLTLMLAEDKLPDIICNTGMNFAEFNEYANQGYFLNLSDYIPQIPNLVALFEEYPSYRTIMTNTDGNIYGLSQLTTINQNAPARGFIDERWLANVDMEVPRSVDELYEVLVAFKEQDANGNGDDSDETPMLISSSYDNRNNAFRIVANAFGIYSDSPTRKMVVDDDGKLFAPWITENWKDFMQYLNMLYEEELIDTNYIVRTSDEFKQMVKEERVGIFGANAPFAQAGKKIDYDANFQYFHPMTSQYSDEATLVLTSGASTSVSFALRADIEP